MDSWEALRRECANCRGCSLWETRHELVFGVGREDAEVMFVGEGPGGYLCAERAAQGGFKVALFEKKALGGTCLNEGCVPTKTLHNSAKLYRHATESAAFGVEGTAVFHHDQVIARKDIELSTYTDLATGKTTALTLPKSNVLVFYFDDARVTCRPSGTEPKIKFYFELKMNMSDSESYAEAKVRGDKAMDKLIEEFMAAVGK